MGVELRDRGIRVTAINPGPVVTDAFTRLPVETQEHFKSLNPITVPEDIADIITFLASPKSRWVNGGTINANNAAAF